MIYVVATSQVKPESRDAFIKGAKDGDFDHMLA